MAASVTADTAPAPETALPEPTDSGAVVESPEDGAAVEASPTPDTDVSVEAGENVDESTPEGKAAKTRSERQRDAWLESLRKDPEKAKELLGPLIEPIVQTERERIETERQATEAKAKADADVAKVAQARTEKLQSWLGVPDAPDKPGTLTTLTREIDDLNRQIRSELTDPKGADLDALAVAVAEREGAKSRLIDNNGMAGTIEEMVWDTFSAEFQSLAMRPEIAGDPAKQQRYLNAPGGVKGAVNTLCDMVAASVEARKDAEIAEIRTKAAQELKAMTADRDIHRFNAGAGPAPETVGAATASGALTRQQFMALPQEQKDKIRREQPQVLADIYSRSA